jgi:hypothetical protein
MTEHAISRWDRWRIVSSGIFACVAALAGLAAQSIAYVHLAHRTDLSTLSKWNQAIYDSEFAPLLLIALLVVWHGGARRGARTWALSLALTSLNGAFVALSNNHPPFLNTLPIHTVSGTSFWFALALSLRASQDFPDPLIPADFARGGRAWRSQPWLRILLRTLLHPLAVWTLILGFFLASYILPSWAITLGKILIVAIATAYWRAQWQVGDELRRRRVGWLLQSALTYVVLSFLGIAAVGAVGSQPSTLHTIISLTNNALFLVLINLCIALAIFRAGAVNPALVVRRTFIYGVAAALLTFGLEVGLHLVTDTVKETLAISDRMQGAVFGAVAGLSFAPVSHRLRKLFDHLSRTHGHEAAHQIDKVPAELVH